MRLKFLFISMIISMLIVAEITIIMPMNIENPNRFKTSTSDLANILESKMSNDLLKYFLSGTNKRIRVIIFAKGKKVDIEHLRKLLLKHYKTFTEFESNLNIYRKMVTAKLSDAYNESLTSILRELKKLPLKIIKIIKPLGAIVVMTPTCLLDELSSMNSVAKIILDKKVHIDLNIASKAIFADYLWKLNITGGNFDDANGKVDVAVLDTGIYNHSALYGKIIASKSFVTGEDANDYNGHGTHVAGIIASQDSTYRGIAWNSSLINAKCFNRDGEAYLSDVMDAAIWAVSQVSDTAEVINFSASINETYPYNDGNSEEAKFFDWIVYTYYVVACTAAGNDGNNGAYSVDSPADAYNVIAVGASNDYNTISRDDDSLAWFSSRGPTADGRIKPDVVAPGVNIISTYPRNTWAELSGTSMATPMISGSAALLIPCLVSWLKIPAEFIPLAVKAILINSADDYGAQGPDNDWGWGYVNLKNAITIANYTYWGTASTVGKVAEYTIEIPAGFTFKATLVWPRHVTKTLVGGFDVSPLTNFSLKLVNSHGVIVAEKNFDGKNNIIQMIVKINTTDNYTLEVHINSMNVDKEYFAISTNIPPSIISPEISQEIFAPKSASDSTRITIAQKVENIGVTPANVNVSISFDNTKVKLLNASATVSIGELQPLEEKNITWIVKALVLGSIDITVYVRYSYYFLQVEERKTVTIYIYDDDANPPRIENINTLGTMFALLKYRIEAKITDPSGVSKAICYIRYNSKYIDENHYDQKIEMKYDASKDVFYCEFTAPFSEVKVYARILAFDNDSDRVNDSAYCWSNVYEIGQVSLLPHFFAILFSIIIIVIVVSKRRK